MKLALKYVERNSLDLVEHFHFQLSDILVSPIQSYRCSFGSCLSDGESAAASVINLSLFEIGTHSRHRFMRDRIGRHFRSGARISITTFLFHPPEGERLDKEALASVLKRYFLEVANLLYARHPSACSLIGWNVQITPSESRFSVVTQYLTRNPLDVWPGGGYALGPISRPIVLYGLARCLYWLHTKHELVHQDLRPSNIWLDDNGYPVVSGVGLVSYDFDAITDCATGGCAKYMAPELYGPSGDRTYWGMDSFSLGMIVYELTENKEPISEMRANESIASAIKRGSRPIISADNCLKDLIVALWNAGRSGTKAIKSVIDYFEDPLNLPAGMNVRDFYRYKGWLDYGESRFRERPASDDFIVRVCKKRSQFKTIVNRGRDQNDILAGLVSWFDNSSDSVDEAKRAHLQGVLTAKSTFDPSLLFDPGERPPCPSLFTTAIETLNDDSIITSIGREGSADVYDCKLSPDSPTIKLKKVCIMEKAKSRDFEVAKSGNSNVGSQSKHPMVI
jgi:serine/threonine protein kinase